jgi:hypothetical protein
VCGCVRHGGRLTIGARVGDVVVTLRCSLSCTSWGARYCVVAGLRRGRRPRVWAEGEVLPFPLTVTGSELTCYSQHNGPNPDVLLHVLALFTRSSSTIDHKLIRFM